MENNSAKTAMSRNDFSGPMKWIAGRGLITNEMKGLDYGCGHGSDADRLGFDGHDKYHCPRPDLLEEAAVEGEGYDVITCIYVLNTIPSSDERLEVEKDLMRCLAPGGTAYLAVRNDKAHLNGWTSKKTWQGMVSPISKKWELIARNGHFRLYSYTAS